MGHARPLEAPAPTEPDPCERLLVVDGDPAFLATLQTFARGRLVDFVGCPSAAQALASARARLPDAAILDAALPGPDAAFALARALRALPGAERMPLAFVAERGTFEDRIAAAHAGGSLFLVKPVDEATFASALQELFAARPAKPKVLLVAEDESFRARTSAVLAGAGILTASAPDARGLVEQLEKLQPDLVLIDLELAAVSALDLCRLVRTSPLFRDLPLVLVTSRTQVEARVAAFQAGVDDLLQKPVLAEELLARLEVRLDRVRLLRERAETDALTGVATRRAFVETATLRLAEARRHQRPLAFALIDLDRFKSVNDERGHLAGDRVLATFGRLLTTRFRATDLRGRWGGEEFALAFPDEAAATAEAVLERLLAELTAIRFEGEDGRPFTASFSAGVAALPADGSSLHELARAADRRLYFAKAAGRARVEAAG